MADPQFHIKKEILNDFALELGPGFLALIRHGSLRIESKDICSAARARLNINPTANTRLLCVLLQSSSESIQLTKDPQDDTWIIHHSLLRPETRLIRLHPLASRSQAPVVVAFRKRRLLVIALNPADYEPQVIRSNFNSKDRIEMIKSMLCDLFGGPVPAAIPDALQPLVNADTWNQFWTTKSRKMIFDAIKSIFSDECLAQALRDLYSLMSANSGNHSIPAEDRKKISYEIMGLMDTLAIKHHQTAPAASSPALSLSMPPVSVWQDRTMTIGASKGSLDRELLRSIAFHGIPRTYTIVKEAPGREDGRLLALLPSSNVPQLYWDAEWHGELSLRIDYGGPQPVSFLLPWPSSLAQNVSLNSDGPIVAIGGVRAANHEADLRSDVSIDWTAKELTAILAKVSRTSVQFLEDASTSPYRLMEAACAVSNCLSMMNALGYGNAQTVFDQLVMPILEGAAQGREGKIIPFLQFMVGVVQQDLIATHGLNLDFDFTRVNRPQWGHLFGTWTADCRKFRSVNSQQSPVQAPSPPVVNHAQEVAQISQAQAIPSIRIAAQSVRHQVAQSHSSSAFAGGLAPSHPSQGAPASIRGSLSPPLPSHQELELALGLSPPSLPQMTANRRKSAQVSRSAPPQRHPSPPPTIPNIAYNLSGDVDIGNAVGRDNLASPFVAPQTFNFQSIVSTRRAQPPTPAAPSPINQVDSLSGGFDGFDDDDDIPRRSEKKRARRNSASGSDEHRADADDGMDCN